MQGCVQSGVRCDTDRTDCNAEPIESTATIWAQGLHGPQAYVGPGPIWAQGQYGPRTHMGPGPTWARAHRGPGPSFLGLIFHQKCTLENKRF